MIWSDVLVKEKQKKYFSDVVNFVNQEKESGKEVYPPADKIFNAFKLTPLQNLKVVIIGQDPYHGPGQAHGLSFSVPSGVKVPPSLRNIYQEIHNDVGGEIPTHGDLSGWARQGVLLLNAVLTVQRSCPASHQGKGWERFTDAVIQAISENKEHVVFLLWGRFAGSKSELVDQGKHLILKAPHPSPFSAHGGFFGCKHFSKTNEYLIKNNLEPINWL